MDMTPQEQAYYLASLIIHDVEPMNSQNNKPRRRRGLRNG